MANLIHGTQEPVGYRSLGTRQWHPLAHALGFQRDKTPAKSTLPKILWAIDAQRLEDALSRWVRSRLPADLHQLSLDGKTLKGSRDGEFPAQHVLSAYAPQVQITRLKPHQADARRLFALVRGHWRIENCLHYVGDVPLGEDVCRVRKGNARQVLAALRHAAVHLLAAVEAESRAAVTEHLTARSPEALQLLGLPSLQ